MNIFQSKRIHIKTFLRIVILVTPLAFINGVAFAQTDTKSSAQSDEFIYNNTDSSAVYRAHFGDAMRQSEEIPTGVPGGAGVIVDLPREGYTAITGINIFHSENRIYGIQFKYHVKYDDPDGDEFDIDEEYTTETIGGTSGQKSTIKLGRIEPKLFSIKGHYADDPDGHYTTPVMTGLTVKYYTEDVYYSAVGRDRPETGRAHSQLLESKLFGSKSEPGTISPREGWGFDVHLGQTVDYLTACISPTDRNGRIFALGARTAGINGDRVAADQLDYCEGDESWKKQPLGPALLQAGVDPFGDIIEDEESFDPYDFASGVYTHTSESYEQTTKNDISPPYLWKAPTTLTIDFGDAAKLQFAHELTKHEIPLVTDPRKMRQGKPGERDYLFEYADDSFFIGVRIEENKDGEKFAKLKFEQTYSNALEGEYREAVLGDGKVAKRYSGRPVVEENAQSKNGLFEQAAVIKNRGYISAGWHGLYIDPFNISAGRKQPIFQESGEFQYYLEPDQNLAISDGLLFSTHFIGSGSSSTNTIFSQRELSESNSESMGGALPVKGVPIGYSSKESTKHEQAVSSKTSKSVAISRYAAYTLALDIPNISISDRFSSQLKELFLATDEQMAQRADSVVEVFGTHYANAIVFGGVAKSIEELSSESYSQSAIESYEQNISIGDPSVAGANLGESSESSRQSKDLSEFGNSSFNFAGGNGVSKFDSWTVSDNYLPILFDLKQIQELVNPLMVKKVEDEWGVEFETQRLLIAKKHLKESVERVFSTASKPSEVSYKPEIYRLRVSDLACADPGDDTNDNTIEFSGTIKVAYDHGAQGDTSELIILDKKSGELTCNGKGNSQYDKQLFLWQDPGTDTISATFSVNIEETDTSALDYDEKLIGQINITGNGASGYVSIGPSNDDVEDNEHAPTISVKYQLERLE